MGTLLTAFAGNDPVEPNVTPPSEIIHKFAYAVGHKDGLREGTFRGLFFGSLGGMLLWAFAWTPVGLHARASADAAALAAEENARLRTRVDLAEHQMRELETAAAEARKTCERAMAACLGTGAAP